MSTSNSNSNTPAFGSADLTQLSAHATELAAELGVDIIGCDKGFNAFKDDDILSRGCTAIEIEQWLEGYMHGKATEQIDQSDRAAPPSATNFTGVEFQVVMKHVRYRSWGMYADHTGVTITGPSFTAHTANSAEFFALVHGFNAAGAVLCMLSTRDAVDENADGED